MGKALVLKNVNFSSNKLDTVVFADIPCTGITLSSSSATITDTTTLTATVTPANTTDEVMWSSGNEHVATVNNGVVTAISAGSTTITADCGEYSATCAVTVTVDYAVYKGAYLQVNVPDSHTLLDNAVAMTGDVRVEVGKATGTYHAYSEKTGASDLKALYPIPIPNGAKTIELTCGNDYAPLMVYYDKDQLSSNASTSPYYDDCAKVLNGQTASGGTDWSITSWVYGNQTINIPDTDGIDSFVMGFYCKSSEAATNFSMSNVTIAFGF